MVSVRPLTVSRSDALRLFLLCGFVFFLPIEEAPANIMGGLYLIWSIGLVVAARVTRVTIASREGVVSVALLIVALSAALSGFSSNYIVWGDLEWFREWISWSAIVLVPLMMLLTTRNLEELDWVLKAIWAGGMLALGDGWITWLSSDELHPQLRSVGHVNQSAMYLVGLIPVFAYLLLSEQTRLWRWLGGLGLGAVLITMEPMRSTIALVVVLALLTGYLGFWLHEKIGLIRAAMFLSCALIIGYIAGDFLLANGSGLISELNSRLSAENSAQASSYRIQLFNSASLAATQNPLLGTGLSTFGDAASESLLMTLAEERGLSWADNSDAYFSSSHGHGLLSTTLLERGYLGLATVLLFLILMLWQGVSGWIRAQNPWARCCFMLTTSCCCALLVGGLGNTTMHNEHGQLMVVSMIIFLMMGLRVDQRSRGIS